jgi:hypothetical protein
MYSQSAGQLRVVELLSAPSCAIGFANPEAVHVQCFVRCVGVRMPVVRLGCRVLLALAAVVIMTPAHANRHNPQTYSVVSV